MKFYKNDQVHSELQDAFTQGPDVVSFCQSLVTTITFEIDYYYTN